MDLAVLILCSRYGAYKKWKLHNGIVIVIDTTRLKKDYISRTKTQNFPFTIKSYYYVSDTVTYTWENP